MFASAARQLVCRYLSWGGGGGGGGLTETIPNKDVHVQKLLHSKIHLKRSKMVQVSAS